jgi:hypothetical protein
VVFENPEAMAEVSGGITVEVQKVRLIEGHYCAHCDQEDDRDRARDEPREKL